MGKSRKSGVSDAVNNAIVVFRSRGGTLRTMDAIRLGIHPRTLYSMRDSGVLEQLGRGLYRLSDLPPLGSPDLVKIAMRVPEGVICLVSALAFHEMTTEIPHAVHVALKRGAEPPRIGHPPVRSYWFTGDAYSEGMEVFEVDGIDVQVYAPAKTVADCFKYRNKLGLEMAIESLKSYLHDLRGRPDELVKYGRVCRVEGVMRPYIEALL